MNLDTNFGFLYYTTNVNIMDFHWKAYGYGDWFDKRTETRKEARKRIKEAVWEDIYDDNPHLQGTSIKFIESFSSGEVPIIQEKDR